MDEIDAANEMAAKYLEINLRAVRANAAQKVGIDIPKTICGDCSYAAVSFGPSCDGWKDCVDDNRRHGLI